MGHLSDPLSLQSAAANAAPAMQWNGEAALAALRVISEAATHGWLVADADGRCRLWNPALARLTGRSAKQVLGQSLDVGLSGELLGDLQVAINAARAGAAIDTLGHYVNAERSGQTWRVTYSVLHDQHGAFIGLCAEVQADSSTDQPSLTPPPGGQTHLGPLLDTLDAAGMMLMRIDEHGQVLDVNAVALRTLGYSREQALTMHSFDVDLDFPLPAFQQAWARLRTTRTGYFRTRYRARDGRIVPVEAFGAYTDAGDHPTAYILARDVSADIARQAGLTRATRETQAILDTVPIGIAWMRPGEIFRGNAMMAAMFGYSIEELICMPVSELWADQEQIESARPDVHAALDAGRSFSIEAQLKRRDGAPMFCIVRGASIDPATWRETGALITFLDVTETRAIEKALRNTLREQSLVFENTPVGIGYIAGGKLMRANPFLEKLFGCPSRTMAGASIADLLVDETAVHDVRALLEQDALHEPYQFTHAFKRCDGTTMICAVHGDWIDHPDQGPATIAVFLDVSRERAAERAMTDSERRFRLLGAIINSVIYIGDPAERKVLYVNARQYHDIYGGNADDLLADVDSALQYLHPDDLPLLEVMRDEAVHNGHGEADFRILHPSKGERIGHVRLYPTMVDEGRMLSFGIVDDVTDQRRTEAQRLRDARDQRDALVREVHHRIKNNLQGVAGLLQQTARQKPQLSQLLTEVVGQIQAIAQVHGLQMRAREALPLIDMLQSVLASAGNVLEAPIHVGYEGAGLTDLQLVEQEAVPVALVLTELANNAIKSRAPGTDVRAQISFCNNDGDSFCVSVVLSNSGQLPDGFDFATIARATNGLGLVKSLLPRRGGALQITQQGDQVIAVLRLSPPAVVKPKDADDETDAGW